MLEGEDAALHACIHAASCAMSCLGGRFSSRASQGLDACVWRGESLQKDHGENWRVVSRQAEQPTLVHCFANTSLGTSGHLSHSGRVKRRQNSLCIAKDEF